MAADNGIEVSNKSTTPQHGYETADPAAGDRSSSPLSSPSSEKEFEPIRSVSPEQGHQGSSSDSTTDIERNNELAQVISRRRTNASGHENDEDWAQIEKLMSRMFGRERQANSEEEKTRHLGVVWKNLTVKGLGLGAALQPTNGDIFLGLPRLIKGLLTRGRKGAGTAKAPVKTILNDFTVGLISESM
ncbi:hypothetical protein PVAR5_2298 [Paecilomyces variotii No. 5]|uniref:Pleiotropic ABC efflux transporter N-terminal domain-containing protein n=1 Tax=Byssochlamys spectabilis (strain No. 5 / NBRC 109023) TaxID=1356009 RepID=V5FAY8_BYSSN|nr:hypothetical protein PVAR5_2298 [Paecilomyces variotii No. 5]